MRRCIDSSYLCLIRLQALRDSMRIDKIADAYGAQRISPHLDVVWIVRERLRDYFAEFIESSSAL